MAEPSEPLGEGTQGASPGPAHGSGSAMYALSDAW
jgi:hypothetical protein